MGWERDNYALLIAVEKEMAVVIPHGGLGTVKKAELKKKLIESPSHAVGLERIKL